MKKSISFVLAVVMTISVLFGLNITSFAANIDLGKKISWSYSSDTKTLTIAGSGEMYNFDDSPFGDYSNIIDSVVISSGVTTIGDNLFSGNWDIQTISISDTVFYIGEGAFENCRYIKEFNIPKSVTAIGKKAFCTASDGAKAFTSAINVDQGNEYYKSDNGILYNYNMTKLIQVPSSISNNSIVIPSTVKEIGEAAFLSCVNLTKVIIPESVNTIADIAFTNCKKLTDITFDNPSNKLNISVNAFKYLYQDNTVNPPVSKYILNNDNMLFKVYQNSSALIYAKNNGISYELLDPDTPIVTGWQKLNGKWYYFDQNGEMLKNSWLNDNGWYYLDGDGVMATGWIKVSNKWYYLNAHGLMLTGWQKINNVWYYLNTSGAMQTGWKQIGNYWYYFNSSGSMRTGWLKSGNYWYYLNSSGSMRTGWLKVSGKWYYLDSPSGRMRTANLTYKGKVYRFYSSGECINP